jgi:hypothetical protein
MLELGMIFLRAHCDILPNLTTSAFMVAARCCGAPPNNGLQSDAPRAARA